MEKGTATEDLLDIALEQSFPASDPPASIAGVIVGAVRKSRLQSARPWGVQAPLGRNKFSTSFSLPKQARRPRRRGLVGTTHR
jgi:hypothetical protein